MSEMEEIVISEELACAFGEYADAKDAEARWKARKEDLKKKILMGLGFEDGEAKPVSVRAVTPTDIPLFEVKCGTRRGLDTGYLKTMHPAVYAECEKTTVTKTIREVTE